MTWTGHTPHAVRSVLFEVLKTSASQHTAAGGSADSSSRWPGEVLHCMTAFQLLYTEQIDSQQPERTVWSIYVWTETVFISVALCTTTVDLK